MKRVMFAAIFAASTLALAPAAFADCVDHSPARAKAAQDAAKRAPFTAEELGMPSLAGLEPDYATIGDPRCGVTMVNGRALPRYNLTSSFAEVVGALYPNIKRATQKDGMNREWFQNPMRGDDITLTSGARLTFIGGRTVNGVRSFSAVVIKPAPAGAALTPETQPYSIQDIVEGTPWPGGGNGPRQFVRADGGDSGYAAPNNNAYRGSGNNAASSTGQTTPANCPPANANASAGAATGAQVGAAVGGAAIGGGYGRSVGATAGAVLGGLGGLGKKKQQQQPAEAKPPGCP
jgi:hypothetical protein